MAAVTSSLSLCVFVGGKKRGGGETEIACKDRFLKGFSFHQLGESILFLFLRTQSLRIKWAVRSRLEQESPRRVW